MAPHERVIAYILSLSPCVVSSSGSLAVGFGIRSSSTLGSQYNSGSAEGWGCQSNPGWERNNPCAAARVSPIFPGPPPQLSLEAYTLGEICKSINEILCLLACLCVCTLCIHLLISNISVSFASLAMKLRTIIQTVTARATSLLNKCYGNYFSE